MPKRFAHLQLAALISVLTVAGCASVQGPVPQQATAVPPEPAVLPTLPPAFQPGEIVGRWGFAAYHREGDRGRTETAAKAGCNNPYVIRPGPTGGVMMHLADDAKASELTLKGAPGGKTYVGPEGPPAGPQDREVVTFNRRILVLRWMDPEVASRYGTSVYVRCGAGRPDTRAVGPGARHYGGSNGYNRRSSVAGISGPAP